MNTRTKLFWASLDFLNKERIELLTSYFGSLEEAAKHFTQTEIVRAGIPVKSANTLLSRYAELNFSKVQKDFENSRACLLDYTDEDFPESLKNIPDPPVFLFVKGNILPQDCVSLSVVGTRKFSDHGKRSVLYFLPDMITSGFTIVSGMARGIDHKGRTIAVWGTGIDRVYPQENEHLARQITENGAVISEFPLGTPPHPYNFPRRNRLISGLSLGTLVIEGKQKSGSIITALLALNQGKEVFAVPGSPFLPLSQATNNLIKKGEAQLVQDPQDILDTFHFIRTPSKPQKFFPENELEKIIFETISTEPMLFDELVYKTKKPAYELSPTLTMMALKGAVTDLGMNRWVRNF
jgi:DNA processing protein